MYTAATQASAPGSILVWASDGTFRHGFGRPGEGPGELLGRSPGRVFVGPADSVFVREADRITVFGPDGVYARVVMAPAVGSGYEHVAVVENSNFLSSGPVLGAEGDSWFHLTDAEGQLERSFGEVEAGSTLISGNEARVPSRSIAYVGGGRFWAAPPPGAPVGYVLEEWTTEGSIVRSLRRSVPWMGKGEAPHAEGPVLPVFRVAADREGLLWITVIVKDARWRPLDREQLSAAEHDNELMTELYDIRYEVIDPASAAVLASGLIDVFPGEDEQGHPPIHRILPRTSLSYRPRPDSLDLITLEFFDLKLVR